MMMYCRRVARSRLKYNRRQSGGLMRLLSVLALVLVLGIVPAGAAGPDTYGAGVSLSETTPTARVIEQPGDFEGKTVRVDGTVTAVCTMMGCWMALAPSDGPKGSTLMIKVD